MNPEITLTNYEDYLLLRTDGELTPAEEAALDQFLARHPELQAEADAYAATKGTPDLSVTHPDVASLLQPEGETAAPRRVRLLPWSLAAAAAIVALAVGVRMLQAPSEAPAPVAGVRTSRPAPQPVSPAPATAPAPSAAHPVQAAAVACQPKLTPPQQTAASPAASGTPAVVPQQRPEEAPLAHLDIIPAEALPESAATDVRLERIVLVVQEPERSSAETPFLQALPLSKERLEGLASLRDAARNSVQRVKETREKLKNTEATVAVAGHELFTIRF